MGRLLGAAVAGYAATRAAAAWKQRQDRINAELEERRQTGSALADAVEWLHNCLGMDDGPVTAQVAAWRQIAAVA